MSNETKYAEYTPEELAYEVEAMRHNIQKENVGCVLFIENDKHIQEVIHKNVPPPIMLILNLILGMVALEKSAILTTSSIDIWRNVIIMPLKK